MEIRKTKLHPGTTFHLFNRGINGAPVFFEERNYSYFLEQYAKYVYPYVETFAYCLLGNHFHLLVKIKTEEELNHQIKKNKEKPYYWHVSNAFSSFLQSYTRGMNKTYERSGSLFESPFKRIAVTEESYFSRLVTYIHENPEKHGIINDFRDYPYSSYQAHLLEKNTKLNREKVLEWFGGKENYLYSHKKENKLSKEWFLEN